MTSQERATWPLEEAGVTGRVSAHVILMTSNILLRIISDLKWSKTTSGQYAKLIAN